jgi:hypothetical protein
MEHDDSALEVLRALALARKRLEAAAVESKARFHHLTVRDTAQGLWIAAALVVRGDHGGELERTLSARNALDGQGWTVEREVAVNQSAIGEPEVLASAELPPVRLATTAELSAELPRLLDEVLAAPRP